MLVKIDIKSLSDTELSKLVKDSTEELYKRLKEHNSPFTTHTMKFFEEYKNNIPF